MIRFSLVALCGCMLLSTSLAFYPNADDAKQEAPQKRAEKSAEKSAAKTPEQEEAELRAAEQARLEKEFEQEMSGATLVGYFTTTGADNANLTAEKYRLKTVKKLEQTNLWLFEYQYGDKGATIPLPLPIQWAGDTPVITLTDSKIPGVGTFTARVLFYRGEYAGTWSAGDHGGQLFGKIEKGNANEAKPADPK